MVNALIGTGQNFCIYNIKRKDEWNDFQLLLEAAAAAIADIQFFAAMQSPTTVSVDNIWFGADGPPEQCADTHDYGWWTCQHDYIGAWETAWINAATALYDLSVTYPNLIGFVIDDYDQIQSADLPECLHGGKLSRTRKKIFRMPVRLIIRISEGSSGRDTLSASTMVWLFTRMNTCPSRAF